MVSPYNSQEQLRPLHNDSLLGHLARLPNAIFETQISVLSPDPAICVSKTTAPKSRIARIGANAIAHSFPYIQLKLRSAGESRKHTLLGEQRTIIALLNKAGIQHGMDIGTHYFHIALDLPLSAAQLA